MAAKIMLSLPESFLAEVDRLAKEEHRSRSELVREALRFSVQARQGAGRPGEIARVQRAIAVQDRLARVAPGKGEDSAQDIRAWRETR